MAHLPEGTDLRTGYCSSNGIYYSTRPPVWIPPNPNLDINTFLFAPQYGDKTALIDAPTGKSLTYRELERKIHVLAAGLYKKLGVRKGDVVMLLTSNTIEFPVVFFAVVSLGAVVTTVNQLNTAKEIQKQMKDSGMQASSFSLCCGFQSRVNWHSLHDFLDANYIQENLFDER